MVKARIRLLYYRDAEPQTFNLASILSYAYAHGELGTLEPTLIVMEGFSRPFCYMGYYQDIDREVIYDNVVKYGVEIVRRWKLGLGNIFMDKVTGGWAFLMPGPQYKEYFRTAAETYDVLVGRVFLNVVKKLGVLEAVYVPPNDIRIHGKKLCGTGVTIVKGSHGEVNFFNAFTNLTHPDPELPFKVLNIPPEKLRDKGVKRPEEYFASIERDGARGAPKPGEFRDALVEGISEALDAEVYEGELGEDEKRVWERYLSILKSEDFIFRRSTSRFKARMPPGTRYGFAQVKYRKLVQASVAVTPDGVIRDVMITGDFGLVPPDLDEEIARLLVGLRVDQFEEAARRVRELVSKPGYEITGASPEEFITPAFTAARKALEHR